MHGSRFKYWFSVAVFSLIGLFLDNSFADVKGGIVRLRLGAFPAQLSPFEYADAYNNAALAVTFERLVDGSGFMPQLSTRFHRQNDVVAIEVDSRATFADGKPVTSGDVIFSINEHIKHGYFNRQEILSAKEMSRQALEVRFKSSSGRDAY